MPGAGHLGPGLSAQATKIMVTLLGPVVEKKVAGKAYIHTYTATGWSKVVPWGLTPSVCAPLCMATHQYHRSHLKLSCRPGINGFTKWSVEWMGGIALQTRKKPEVCRKI